MNSAKKKRMYLISKWKQTLLSGYKSHVYALCAYRGHHEISRHVRIGFVINIYVNLFYE